MGTSFNDAFGSDFMQSLGPDNPNPRVMAGVPQNNGDPQNLLPPQYSDPNSQNQPAPQNVMQGMVDPGAPTQFGQIAPLHPTVAPVRQRHSLMDIIGQIGNVMANAHNGTPQYLTPLQQEQQRQMQQQAVDAGALNNTAKQQDIAQTGVTTQQNANQVVGGFARGLQSLQAAGSNLDISAPALAQQLGIPPQQAAVILAKAKTDPNFLSAFADAADPQKGGNAGKALALAFTNAVGPDGKPVLLQAGADGSAHPLAGYTPLGDVKVVDNGTTNDVINKQGAVVRSFARSGAPESGTVAGPGGTYQALPGSTRALTNQKDQAALDALHAKNEAATQGQKAALNAAQANISTISRAIDVLDKLNAQPSVKQNAVENAVNYLQGSTVGQAVSHVTNPQVAQARDQIKAAGQGLLVAAAHGMSSLFRNKTEQQNFQNMINNPQSSVETMRNALRTISLQMAPQSPAATNPAAPRAKLTPTYKVANW